MNSLQIIPFLGKVSANLNTTDAVDIAFNAVFEAIQNIEMEVKNLKSVFVLERFFHRLSLKYFSLQLYKKFTM